MQEKQLKVYLASPLGFSLENNYYRERIKERLRQLHCSVFDPWEQAEVTQRIETAMSIGDSLARDQAIREAAFFTGAVNAEGIRSSDLILAVLDGMEPDSGTASEVGFGAGIGKKCFGLRTDFRACGDLPGIPINLQVLYFIDCTGGELFRKIEDIVL